MLAEKAFCGESLSPPQPASTTVAAQAIKVNDLPQTRLGAVLHSMKYSLFVDGAGSLGHRCRVVARHKRVLIFRKSNAGNREPAWQCSRPRRGPQSCVHSNVGFEDLNGGRQCIRLIAHLHGCRSRLFHQRRVKRQNVGLPIRVFGQPNFHASECEAPRVMKARSFTLMILF
jgi:hypothetical protein